MNSPKYNRTLHLPWSEGATSDDKISKDVESLLHKEIVITEKVDGSNTSIEAGGCFARSHNGPPTHSSFDGLKALHSNIKYSIPDNIQIFGEWCFALHSIAYDKLPGYFLMFAIRELDKNGESFWYSWDEVKAWAEELNIPTVPVLWQGIVSSEKELRSITNKLVFEKSVYGETREGIVIRLADVIPNKNFSESVMKWVRKNHVQTSDHWTNQQVVRNKLAK